MRYENDAMSAAKVALVRYCRCVLPVVPVHGVRPMPWYFAMAQMRPEALSGRFASGVEVAVRTASPSS